MMLLMMRTMTITMITIVTMQPGNAFLLNPWALGVPARGRGG